MRSLLLVALAFGLTGCKTIKVQNGEIPDNYRAMAQAYMGTYSGSMDGRAAQITLSLNGRKAVASFKDAAGQDILDPRCQSKIGELKSVEVSQTHAVSEDSKSPATYRLDAATFAFDPNRCWGSVDGRELVLTFKKSGAVQKMSAEILVRQDFQRDCRIDPGNPSRGVPPREICNETPIETYTTGQFRKSP